jgi:hypothetical protein
MGVAARAGNRGTAQRGCDRPRERKGRCAATGNPPASSLRGLLLDADTMLLKILPKPSEAAASSEQGPRATGMRAPVRFVRVQLLPGDKKSPFHSLQEVSHGY